MAFEKYLVDYCSPTLASVKTANLFNWFYESSTELWEQVSYWNLLMNPQGRLPLCFKGASEKSADLCLPQEPSGGEFKPTRRGCFSGRIRIRRA